MQNYLSKRAWAQVEKRRAKECKICGSMDCTRPTETVWLCKEHRGKRASHQG